MAYEEDDGKAGPISDFPSMGPELEPEARNVLNAIDDLIANMSRSYDRGKALEQVIAVLRALRGPDNQNGPIKRLMTAQIRHVAFPKSGHRFGDAIDDEPVTEELIQQIRTTRKFGDMRWSPNDVQEHFFWSAIKAVRALGLVKYGHVPEAKLASAITRQQIEEDKQ